jgi:multisubunit Na+/H+ antiporter MnhB subunit
VDFRGFDTMGEISVIVIAGVAAIAVLRAGRKASR